LLDAERLGATVLFLPSLNGSIEPADDFQWAVSSMTSAVASLAYDRESPAPC
jgi:hypothetical protein